MSGPLCKNCGKLPSEHAVRNERLVCRDVVVPGATVWEWSDEDKLARISSRIGEIDAERERLVQERDALLGR